MNKYIISLILKTLKCSKTITLTCVHYSFSSDGLWMGFITEVFFLGNLFSYCAAVLIRCQWNPPKELTFGGTVWSAEMAGAPAVGWAVVLQQLRQGRRQAEFWMRQKRRLSESECRSQFILTKALFSPVTSLWMHYKASSLWTVVWVCGVCLCTVITKDEMSTSHMKCLQLFLQISYLISQRITWHWPKRW